MSNYLDKSEKEKTYQVGSYLRKTVDSYKDMNIYEALLPDNFNVFSDIEWDKIFENREIDRIRLSKFVSDFKRAILECSRYEMQEKVLPKLKCSIDEDDALLFTWTHGFFRIFMSIEVKDNESYYGMHYHNLSTDEIESRSAKFPQDKYFQILMELTNRVLEIL